MPKLAAVGSKPGTVPFSNVFDWVFSNPFHKDSTVIQHAPTEEDRKRNLPRIELSKPYLVDPKFELSISFEKAYQDALRVATGLRTICQQGAPTHAELASPVVLLHLPNCVHYAPLVLGVFAAGFIATMASPALTATELEWIISSARPSIIATTPSGYEAIKTAISVVHDTELKRWFSSGKRILLVDPSAAADPVGKETNSAKGTLDWGDLLRYEPLQERPKISQEQCHSATALILWSSGTSGKSKGVRLSHGAMISTMLSVWYANKKYDENQRWLGFVPFFHTFGLLNVLLLAACCGSTIFVMQQFDPQQMVSLIQEKRITYIHMAPPVGLLLAKSPLLDRVDVSSVQRALSGGAPLGAEVIEAVYKRLGILILMGYGLSEAGGVCNQIAENWEELEAQLGCTGKPMYGVELQIISTSDSRRVLNVGETGEVFIRSPSNMLGYLNNKAATEDCLDKDGWLHTGDVGKIDEHGRLWVTDRLKEMIKVKGFQVSPADLEGILCSCEFVTDAAVTGVYDAEEGTEYPRAYIVPSSPQLRSHCVPASDGEASPALKKLAEQIKAWTTERMADYKWLRGNVVFTQQIPKSPSGKILRRLLKEVEGVEVVLYEKKNRATSLKL